jgi:hypothetical protein
MNMWSPSEAATPVQVDLGAAAEIPQQGDIDTWARGQTVFISSVMGDDLDATRAAVAEAVGSFGSRVSIFERFGGRDDDPEQAYIAEVAASTIYVGLLAGRYGSQHEGGFSATHLEFIEARQRRLRLCVFNDRNAAMEGHQRSFLDEVRRFHTTGSYTSPESAAAGVADRLRQIAAEEIAPWVLIDGLVVRARSSDLAGDRLALTLIVRDDNVRRRLEQLGDHRRGAQGDVRIVEHGRVHRAQVTGVRRTSTSNVGHNITLAATVSPVSQNGLAGGSLSTGGRTYSAEELAKLSVGDALFGTTTAPQGAWGRLPEPNSPLDALKGLPLSDAVRRPVVRLVLTSWLVTAGHGDWVTSVDLGAANPDKTRSLRIEWGRRSPYTGGQDTVLSVEGTAPAF